jgi:hypothetical protein
LFNANSAIFQPYNGKNKVIMLVLSAVDRGFQPRSGQTKDYNIGICCFSGQLSNFSAIQWQEQSNFQEDDEVHIF